MLRFQLGLMFKNVKENKCVCVFFFRRIELQELGKEEVDLDLVRFILVLFLKKQEMVL